MTEAAVAVIGIIVCWLIAVATYEDNMSFKRYAIVAHCRWLLHTSRFDSSIGRGLLRSLSLRRRSNENDRPTEGSSMGIRDGDWIDCRCPRVVWLGCVSRSPTSRWGGRRQLHRRLEWSSSTFS